jgi:nucleotide-binding universal stress UspA family protein
VFSFKVENAKGETGRPIMPFKRILTAVDFSANSLEAFRVAAEMAAVHSEALPSGPGEATVEFVQKANQAVEQLVASSQPALERVTLATEVASGRAFDEIVNRARDWRADLIVLGTKGTTSLEQIFLGGTAEHVIKESACSVLIVRPQDRA